MKKLSILTLLLMMATFVFANNNEPETNEAKNGNEVETDIVSEINSSGEEIYFGTKVGIFRPCRGETTRMCKKATYSQTEKGKLIVTDGETTIIVDVSQFNFEDGSVEM